MRDGIDRHSTDQQSWQKMRAVVIGINIYAIPSRKDMRVIRSRHTKLPPVGDMDDKWCKRLRVEEVSDVNGDHADPIIL